MHLMAAHGPKFRPRVRHWSTEDDYDNIWSPDGYDDAVADFDRYLSEAHAALVAAGVLEQSLLVVTSDHGRRHEVLQRVPLAFRFPGRSHAGRIPGTAQRLDVAPTLLDAIGVTAPDWMEGVSLIEREDPVPLDRPVFATRVKAEKAADGIWWSAVDSRPPWYSLGYLYLVHCDQGLELRLVDLRLKETPVPGMPSCGPALSTDQARERLLAHLKDRGYRW